MSHSARWLAPACVLAILLPLQAAQAAEKRARFTVTVSVEGTEGVVGTGSDRTSAKFREGYTLVTYLKSDGDLQQFNTKDPAYAQKMMGLSQNVQRKVNAAQGKAPPKKMTQQQLQEYVQKKQAACGADQTCLMSLATEVQQLMANMDMGGATAAGNESQAYTGDEPPRYLDYFGYDNCGATAQVYVDRTTTGTLGDTSGAVPYTVIDKADYRGTPVELRLYCNTHTLVIDSQDGSFYTDSVVVPTAKGTSVMTMRGKTEQSTGEAATHGEVYTWVVEQLRHAPPAGSKSTTIKLTQGRGAAIHSGRYSGEARVSVSWKLEDVK
jgi:hypothetical protein